MLLRCRKWQQKKTTGVLGDDLALNAQQVSGIRAERELPVVWAVTKGSLKNKLILVPAALLISAFLPQAIIVLLMIGGAYLCFEGAEKVLHTLFHAKAEKDEKRQLKAALEKSPQDLMAFEKEKIRGAVRTDFILSAEIIVITLGSVAEADLLTRIIVVALLALAFTFGVYGIVAAIVKMDDAGLWLSEREGDGAGAQRLIGRLLLGAAPKLMKLLAIVGTIAMFLVGGGILMHGIPALEHLNHAMTEALVHGSGSWLAALGESVLLVLFNMIAGGLAGLVLVAIVSVGGKLMEKAKSS